MKVAYVYDAVYPYVKGGVERRIREVAARLAARGHEVHVYGMKFWDGPDAVEAGGVTLHGVCPATPLYAGGRRSVAQAIRVGRSVLRPLLREGRFDVIDCQAFPYFPCFAAKAASVMTGSPLVITWAEVWDGYWYEYLGRRGWFGRLIERSAARLTDRAIATSPLTARALADLGMGHRIEVSPCGVDLREVDAAGPADEGSDVVFAGRLIREKHVDVLLRALALLRERIPDLRAVVVGDGPERPALERLARDLGLEDAVAFTGFLPDHEHVIAAMKASRVFALPSTREGFGIAALEAMACGLPVVTADHPRNAVRDLVSDRTGLLCRLTPEDLAEAIAAALDSYPSQAPACRAAAEGFDWELIAERLEKVYQSIRPTQK